jgi:hypothetical protein
MRGALGGVVAAACAGCGGAPTQVSFVSHEQPSTQGAPEEPTPAGAHHEHPNGAAALPGDEQIVEPERPLVETKQERGLVHVHAPDGAVCSGVVMGARFVATSQQCLAGEGKGVTELEPRREYRVEIASSGFTWTVRRAKWVVVPACTVDEMDVALLVLADAAAWVDPLRVVAAPPPGVRVQALGFGRCTGETRPARGRVGVVRSRVSEAIVIDVPLCRGDVGGPVIEGADVIGLISHRDDPEGSPLRTTTIARLDTTSARALLAQARSLADGAAASTLAPVACR